MLLHVGHLGQKNGFCNGSGTPRATVHREKNKTSAIGSTACALKQFGIEWESPV